MRAFTTAILTPRFLARCSRFGQNSVSASTSRRGCNALRNGRTAKPISMGRKKLLSAPKRLRACSCPVWVVVETHTGYCRSSRTRLPMASTSPTETA